MNNQVRSLFPITQNFIYMNHATVSPLSTRVRDAMIALIDDVTAAGVLNYDAWCETYERARMAAARLVNGRPHEFAFMRNTSDAISTIANGIEWREHDNVVTCEIEFPANVYPWMRLEQTRGIELRMAPARDGRIDVDELLSLVDERTRVIAISWVQFSTGFRIDLARVGRFCRERGIILSVDAIQGLGGLKLDVERDMVDTFSADAHKYLLGPEGIALLYVSDRILEHIKPSVVGWTSVVEFENYLDYDLRYRAGALRFEPGTLNTAGIYGLAAALELLLDSGPEVIESHLLNLSEALATRIEAKGYEVVGGREHRERSGIVACKHPRHSPGSLYRLLLSQKIVTAPRVRKLRISPHFYNTMEEVDALVKALPE